MIKKRKGDVRNSLLIIYYLRLYRVIPECSTNVPLKKKDKANKHLANPAAASIVGTCRALQCGPGLGRLKNVLLKEFSSVDLVSASRNLLDASRKDLGRDSSRVERIYHTQLDEFKPEPTRFYDMIWLQSTITHLADEELVALLMRLKAALTPISKTKNNLHYPNPLTKNAASKKFSEHLLKQLPLDTGGVVVVKVHVPSRVSANATQTKHVCFQQVEKSYNY